MLPRSLDPRDLPAQLAGFSHWFRYSLHARDFHPLREAGSNGKWKRTAADIAPLLRPTS